MLHIGYRRTRSVACALACASVVLILAACTTDPTLPPGTDKPTTTATPTDSATETPEPTVTPFPANAAVTLAGVDIDGANVTVAGVVTGVVEDGGTCLFIATSDTTGATVELVSEGVGNISNTVCSSAQSPIDSFAKGPWSVVLKYSSEATEISSAPQSLEIP